MPWTSYDTPGEFFGAGYALETNQMKLNTNDAASDKLVTEVTDAEANATTGDARKVIFGLMEMLYAKMSALATADKPTKLAITRSISEDTVTGEFIRTYLVTVRTTAAGFEVSSEP